MNVKVKVSVVVTRVVEIKSEWYDNGPKTEEQLIERYRKDVEEDCSYTIEDGTVEKITITKVSG